MHKKIVLFTFVLIWMLNFAAFPSVPVEKTTNNVRIEFGDSTRDMMPFLEKIAYEWGKYFKSIYGDYRQDQILIKIKSNAAYLSLEELRITGDALASQVATTYPLCKATITFFPAESEKSWESIVWTVSSGQLINYEEH